MPSPRGFLTSPDSIGASSGQVFFQTGRVRVCQTKTRTKSSSGLGKKNSFDLLCLEHIIF